MKSINKKNEEEDMKEEERIEKISNIVVKNIKPYYLESHL